MSEEFIKRDSASAEVYKNFPDLKAATGFMRLEITRGNVVEEYKATSFYMRADETYALIFANIGDALDGQRIKINSFVKMEAGKRYILGPGNESVLAWYIDMKGGGSYESIGSGKLDVETAVSKPPKPYIKGSIEFMCRETPFSDTWMKVVAKDFWVEGDMS
ncbi:hypothetical protein PSJE_16265 [Pseudomonas jessenii]|jgi:hypothetical protein|uniref:Uncharacterized protein n=2 Tax=Pseudomonas TaxID=286 RepID=A0A231GJU9_PSEJE|nr:MULTISPECIES: hypothetical protein [Pseudomonas]OXR36886.1 hypothetical protein PSJE_16265 [Pseudomonas jessenii]SEB86987.1 hypothetical protein SAMN04490187_2281 [Pseudomonas jessenii]VVQ17227.1 hypothetical protein PS922_05580 [Pseudomonas fluorescens]